MVTKKNLKILVVGQSNAAGFGTNNYTAQNSNVSQLTVGASSVYADPITWGDHDTIPNSGSVWGRVGDNLMDTGFFSAVGFEVIAVGSSSVFNWDWLHLASQDPVRGYYCAARLDAALDDYTWDAVVWVQGEQETFMGGSEAEYTASILNIIERIRTFTSAPIFITLCSYAFGATSNAVRAAQTNIVKLKAGINVWLSFDMDNLVPYSKRRDDNVHLNEAGLIACANAWSGTLLPHLRGSF